MASRIFLTGADGFIGSHLTEQLLFQGYSVTALAQYNSFNSHGWLTDINSNLSGNLQIVMGDIRDANQMRDVTKNHDAIIHLAALIAIPYSYTSVSSYVETNVIGTLNLLEAAKQNGVEKFIHTSTSEVYGTAKTVPISEKHLLNPQSPYAASKVAADALVNSYFCSYDLPLITVRPFNTYGPRQSQRAIVPTILGQILAGNQFIKLGALTPTRDLTYVTDTCLGFIAALQTSNKDVFGQVINLGTGFEISIGDLFSLIRSVLEVEIEIEVATERLRPPSSEVERLLSDNSLAKLLLGWEPKHQGSLGLSEGVNKTYEWFKKSGKDFEGSKYVR